jgi:hypothetical protein
MEKKIKLKLLKLFKKKVIILIILFFINIILYKNLFFIKYKYKNLLSLRRLGSFCIITVIGTRPDVLKMIPIIKELKNSKNFFV